MSDLRERKLQRYFEAIDNDGDGVLTRDDFTAVAQRYVQALALAAGSAQERTTAAATVKIWDDLIAPMDADGSGQVTFAEFGAAFGQLLLIEREAYAASIRPSADAYFDLCDTDGSGEVTQAEYVRLMGAACGIPAEEAAATYRSLVPAGHAGMTRDSWHQMLLEFFYDQEPDAPANHLFGRI
ncbi:EF-hand domain-containing protein [Nonomuraea endophytica]|uniref:EF-hand domain-containing protein n=1 Tax=Nonomuraea endophytica TaxID=714136 RepID=UPI0037CB4189